MVGGTSRSVCLSPDQEVEEEEEEVVVVVVEAAST
jgi:hypothetical protein